MNHRPAAALATLLLLIGSNPAIAADKELESLDRDGKLHYAVGYQLGRDLAGIQSRPDALIKGMEDGRKGEPPGLNEQEMQAALNDAGQAMSDQRRKAQAEASKNASSENAAFLAENAKKAGVKTTASGLQYRVVTEGSGASPTTNDSVTVHYRGQLIDGTEFDSSYNRGEPASFPVTGVIAGWTEALQLMKPGAKFQLYIPPELAYGSRGPLANRLLIFDVELLEVVPGGADK